MQSSGYGLNIAKIIWKFTAFVHSFNRHLNPLPFTWVYGAGEAFHWCKGLEINFTPLTLCSISCADRERCGPLFYDTVNPNKHLRQTTYLPAIINTQMAASLSGQYALRLIEPNSSTAPMPITLHHHHRHHQVRAMNMTERRLVCRIRIYLWIKRG